MKTLRHFVQAFVPVVFLVLNGCVTDQLATKISTSINKALSGGPSAPSSGSGTVTATGNGNVTVSPGAPGPGGLTLARAPAGSYSPGPPLYNVEACDHPDHMRSYLSNLSMANPLLLGWAGLFGGINEIQEHCRRFNAVTPMANLGCVSIGWGYEACPAAIGDYVIWTWGRDGALSPGLN